MRDPGFHHCGDKRVWMKDIKELIKFGFCGARIESRKKEGEK